jgi:hypothetical protein
MAREFRIECDKSIDRAMSVEALGKSPFFHRPLHPFQEGEVWLTMATIQNYADVRVFPRPFGFFLEISNLPESLLKSLQTWIAQLRSLGVCSIVDNDTDEVVDILR